MADPVIVGWIDDPESPDMGYIIYEDGTKSEYPIFDADGSTRNQIKRNVQLLSGRVANPQIPDAAQYNFNDPPQYQTKGTENDVINPIINSPVGNIPGVRPVVKAVGDAATKLGAAAAGVEDTYPMSAEPRRSKTAVPTTQAPYSQSEAEVLLKKETKALQDYIDNTDDYQKSVDASHAIESLVKSGKMTQEEAEAMFAPGADPNTELAKWQARIDAENRAKLGLEPKEAAPEGETATPTPATPKNSFPTTPTAPGLVTARQDRQGPDPAQRKALLSYLSDADRSLGQAIYNQGQINRQIGTRNVDYFNAQIKKRQEEEDGLRRDLLIKQKAANESQRRIQSIGDERINPARFLTDGDPDSVAPWAILTAIGTFIGGINARRRGSPNEFMQMMDKYMEQEIDLQTKNKASRLSIYTNKLGDQNAAVSLLKSDIRQSVVDRLNDERSKNLTQDQTDAIDSVIQIQLAQLARERGLTHQQLLDNLVTSSALPKPTGTGTAGLNVETAEEQAVLKKNGIDSKTYSKYGEDRLKTNADATIGNINRTRGIINKLSKGEDVPGLGPWDEFMTKWGGDPDGGAVQQALGMTRSAFIKSVSGASTTESEREQLVKDLEGPDVRKRKAAIIRGLELIENQAKDNLEVLDNGNPGASRSYNEIQGLRGRRRRLSDEQEANKKAQQKPIGPPAAPPVVAPGNPMINRSAPLQKIFENIRKTPQGSAPPPSKARRSPL